MAAESAVRRHAASKSGVRAALAPGRRAGGTNRNPRQRFCRSRDVHLVRGGRRREHRQDLEDRSEEHTSELQSHSDLVCRLLLEKKKIPDELGPLVSERSGDLRTPQHHGEQLMFWEVSLIDVCPPGTLIRELCDDAAEVC